MEWTTYALIAAGCLGTISLVMGLIDILVWKRWEAQQRSQHLAWLEDEARAQRLLARSLRAELDEVRGEYGHQREQAFMQGWDDGHAEGYAEGWDDGHAEGYDEGHYEGVEEGRKEGFFLGQDAERAVWQTNLGDDADPFGMERPLGVYDEPDNGDPAVTAWLNGAQGEAI